MPVFGLFLIPAVPPQVGRCRIAFSPSLVSQRSRPSVYETRVPKVNTLGICRNGGSGSGGHGHGRDEGDEQPGEGGNRFPWLIILLFAAANLVLARRTDKDETLLDTVSTAVSIIVPALNEDAGNNISECIRHLRSLSPPAAEIIVVDGGSRDRTVASAKKAGANKVLRSPKGRARQQNLGAAAAKSELLLFVHADSRPPRDAIARIRRTLARPDVNLGGFATLIERPSAEGNGVLWFTTLHNFLATYYAPMLFLGPVSFARGCRCMFGDQSLFCRSEDFKHVGGFDERLPIMEDADLCLRLHKAGVAHGRGGQAVQLLRGPLNRTSGRRIGSWGNIRATLIQFRISLAWWRGAGTDKLTQMYEEEYTDNYRGYHKVTKL